MFWWLKSEYGQQKAQRLDISHDDLIGSQILPENIPILCIIYPLVNIQKAIENGTFIVDLPMKNGDFP